MEQREKMKRITAHFGIETELTKLSEEIGELLNECYKSHFTNTTNENIEDELADVAVILGQICLYFNADMGKIQSIVDMKVDRTVNRIEDGWYNKHR